MGALAINVEVSLTQITCGGCGGVYAIAERYRAHCLEHARSWTCPYCKIGWGYPGKTEAEKERDRHQRTLAQLNEEKERAAALERKLKRVARGVCPDCNRTFANLARHMACKHGKKEA